jgi:serine/threonine-protein kinase
MLESNIPDTAIVLSCFVKGAMKYYAKVKLSVENLRQFVDMFRTVSKEKQNIIIANLSTRLDAVKRYSVETDDDIPF